MGVQPTPRSLILDLLSTLRRGSFPVGALVAAGGYFGLEEGTLRVALSRLLEARLVERAGRGRYRLGPGASAVQGRVMAAAGLEERTRPWAGGWIGVHVPDPVVRSERGRSERALHFLGFRALAPGLAVRPDNLAGGVDGVRAALRDLGLAPDATLFALSALDADVDVRARGLWDVAALRRTVREARQAIERSEKRLPKLAAHEAMVESFLVGGGALRTLALDPLLPEPIVPGAERQALVLAMRRYDRSGKKCWAPFLEEHGVLSPRTPAHTGGAAHGAALATVGGIA